ADVFREHSSAPWASTVAVTPSPWMVCLSSLMNGRPRAGSETASYRLRRLQSASLERFRAKGTPVRWKKTRQNKNLDVNFQEVFHSRPAWNADADTQTVVSG